MAVKRQFTVKSSVRSGDNTMKSSSSSTSYAMIQCSSAQNVEVFLH